MGASHPKLVNLTARRGENPCMARVCIQTADFDLSKEADALRAADGGVGVAGGRGGNFVPVFLSRGVHDGDAPVAAARAKSAVDERSGWGLRCRRHHIDCW